MTKYTHSFVYLYYFTRVSVFILTKYLQVEKRAVELLLLYSYIADGSNIKVEARATSLSSTDFTNLCYIFLSFLLICKFIYKVSIFL